MAEKQTTDKSIIHTSGDNDELKINIMAQDVAWIVYKNQLSSLKDTLDRFHIPGYYYSVLSDKDEASCMTYSDGEWSVYYSERGQKSNLRKAGDINDACIMLLHDIAEEDEYHQMIDYFRHQMDGRASVHPTSLELYKAIQSGFTRIARIVL